MALVDEPTGHLKHVQRLPVMLGEKTLNVSIPNECIKEWGSQLTYNKN